MKFCKLEIQKDIVKTELGYYVHTHKYDKSAKSDLFRLNKISHDEKLENLTLLLAGDDSNTSSNTICDLPTNEDVLHAMKDTDLISTLSKSPRPNLQINEICVSAWQESVDEYVWYIGYVKKIEDEGFIVDYMHRSANSDLKWKYPEIEDVEVTEDSEIVPCTVDGIWDTSPDARNRLVTLIKNVNNICDAFQKHIQ